MKKKSKVRNELVFDNKKREEFLKGFSKRKKQRQKKAQEEIELKLKEERKRIKDEAKNLKEKFKHSFKPIDDLKGIVSDDESEAGVQEFETDDVKVVVRSLDLPRKKKPQETSSDEEGDDGGEMEKQNDGGQACVIKGMEIEEERRRKPNTNAPPDIASQLKIGSSKDLKRLIDKHTKTAMKKSDVIKKKNVLNHKKNVKLSQRKKHFKTKFLKKHKKIPNKSRN